LLYHILDPCFIRAFALCSSRFTRALLYSRFASFRSAFFTVHKSFAPFTTRVRASALCPLQFTRALLYSQFASVCSAYFTIHESFILFTARASFGSVPITIHESLARSTIHELLLRVLPDSQEICSIILQFSIHFLLSSRSHDHFINLFTIPGSHSGVDSSSLESNHPSALSQGRRRPKRTPGLTASSAGYLIPDAIRKNSPAPAAGSPMFPSTSSQTILRIREFSGRQRTQRDFPRRQFIWCNGRYGQKIIR
jgi:hypothetical protein